MKVIIGTFGSNDSDHDDLVDRNLEINLNLFHREKNLILKEKIFDQIVKSEKC